MAASPDHPGLPVWDIPRRRGPWTDPEALRFYGGPLSSFAGTAGLRLPEGWYGHSGSPEWVEVTTAEHYFQACKADEAADFLWVLSAPSARQAKARGGPRGEGGRRINLRPDWEEVKFSVMRVAHTAKHRLPRYRDLLPTTGDRVLVEDSPSDSIWGGRDDEGEMNGSNLLGVVLMEVRAEQRAELARRE